MRKVLLRVCEIALGVGVLFGGWMFTFILYFVECWMIAGIFFRDIFGGGGISTLLPGIRMSIIWDFGTGIGGGSYNFFVRSTLGYARMIDGVCL